MSGPTGDTQRSEELELNATKTQIEHDEVKAVDQFVPPSQLAGVTRVQAIKRHWRVGRLFHL